MPIYEYRCTHCHQSFSLLQRVGASAADTSCPHCGGQVSRLHSSFASTGGDRSAAPPSLGSGCGSSGFS
jgi:putative FmdB family regulatory protein